MGFHPRGDPSQVELELKEGLHSEAVNPCSS